MKSALITGISGQDGSYLAELLLSKGYKVYGLTHRASATGTERIAHLLDRIELIPGDIFDEESLGNAVQMSRPDEVYNLAAQSLVQGSWAQAVLTTEFTATGVIKLLEAVRKNHAKARFYQASSSEIFGKPVENPQTEITPFYPRSPYGVAKLFGHWMTINYREHYGMHASSGILYNHESPRRGLEFVTRKITSHVALIKHGKAQELRLGSLDARRDWGFAGDYVRAMWLMMQQDAPGDYVISTGETHTVRELVELAFSHAGLDWRKYVKIDPQFVRPPEAQQLVGCADRAREILGWKPEVDFAALVRMMVDADLKRVATA